jgi:hypothetical protein
MPGPGAVHIGPSDTDRYGWAAAPEEELAAASTRIARHIARARAGVVALLPVDGRRPLDDRVAPALMRLGEALLGFADGNVAVIDTWRTWPWGEAVEWGQTAAHRSRWLKPRILEIAPVPCGDSEAAAIALENALAARPQGLMTTLVNLAGYAARGAVRRLPARRDRSRTAGPRSNRSPRTLRGPVRRPPPPRLRSTARRPSRT